LYSPLVFVNKLTNGCGQNHLKSLTFMPDRTPKCV
jgi:hypothetical protein